MDGTRELATTALQGTPSQLIVSRDGRLIVALRDRARVEVLEPAGAPETPLDVRCDVPTPDEPVALAMTPDDATLLVSSGWGHALAAFEGASLAPAFERTLPREPRAVVVSEDGRQAFVTHAVGGTMTVVDLVASAHTVSSVDMGEQGDLRAPARLALVHRQAEFDESGNVKKPRPVTEAIPRVACQGFALARTTEPAGRILAPEVLVDTGDPAERPGGYGNAGQLPTEMPTIAVVDDVTRAPMEASLTVQATSGRTEGQCLLPRAAAVDPVLGTVLVACLGIDAIVAYDAAAAQPANAEVRRWDVAGGPTGVAVDATGRRSVVWSQFDRILSVIALDGAEEGRPVQVALSRQASPPSEHDLVTGRKLFHEGLARDGRACASCHPDGRDDGLVWSTPEGTRQTPSLAGRLEGTAPYAWNGSGETLQMHLANTFARLGARSLDRRQLDALMAYAMVMPGPSALGTRGAAAELARGREIFHSTEAGCSTCHGMDGQAPDGLRHAISETVEYDTPSLRFAGGTAPYFHDGRFGSLGDMLAATDGAMGKTHQLSPDDRRALETYLRSL
jgi:mono/diheme cytochrome c family protein/DNA-binding beta-propeller fold protein YncE